jgi:hypothetical protein
MTEPCDWNDAANEVESLVRAAGDYVRASDDLRPRVLEAARLQHRERRVQVWIRHVAAIVIVLGFTTAVGRHELGEGTVPLRIVAAAGFDEFFSPTAAASKRSGDGDWRMFEAFSELRRQQAQVLRLSL